MKTFPSGRLVLLAWLGCSVARAGLGDPERSMASVVEVLAWDGGGAGGAQGSGVVIAPGRIVTNYHVVENRRTVRIRPRGRLSPREFPATVLRTDPARDLALLSCPQAPPAIPLGGGAAVDGFVHAIGYPLGTRRITHGRILGVVQDSGCLILQTSADLDHGNSGGALVDEEGNLVGINFRASRFWGKTLAVNEAIHIREVLDFAGGGSFPPPSGFFPPSGDGSARRVGSGDPSAPPVQDELPNAGGESDEFPPFVPEPSAYSGPRLGARLEKCFNVFGTLNNQGMRIIRMDPGGAAELAGLRTGDEILTMNDGLIGSLAEFLRQLEGIRPGTRVVFQILRNGLFQEVTVMLGGSPLRDRPAPSAASLPVGGFPPCDDARRLGLSVSGAEAGLEITSVVPGGEANYARLRPGDIILGLNGRPPGSPYEFVLRLHSFRAGTPVRLLIRRGGKTETVTALIRGG